MEQLPLFEIKVDNMPLQLVSHYKYLGVTLDSQLNYNKHVQRVISNVTIMLKQLRCMRYFLDVKSATLVYKNMILPIIEYGDIFMVGTNVENRKKLKTLQNKGLRCALGLDRITGKVEIHKESKLHQLKHRREMNLLCHMYDVSHLSNQLQKQREVGVKTQSHSKRLVKIQKPSTEKYKKSLAYRGPKLWNDLPGELHHLNTRS